MPAVTDREGHYEFGENWARFAETVTEHHIARAQAGLEKLLGQGLRGRSFLEIGCGSGIHSLAALRLGAAPLQAIDIDERAAETARRMLERHAPHRSWTVQTRSILDIAPGESEWDVVYSWGALHHTGAMRDAIGRSASLVGPGGTLVLALYRKTLMCRFWRWEKRLYVQGPRAYRSAAELVLTASTLAALVVTGRNPWRYVRRYPEARGMSFATDIRDWLGGYPYESASPDEIRRLMLDLGFVERRFFPCRTRVGLLGVGCDEYVFARRDA